MTLPHLTTKTAVSFYISRSEITTEANKTGTWRFVRPVYADKTAPCSAACPAGEDIAKIEMLAHQGLLQEAWETILMENPFPSVCGRVCFHTCEASCNRSFYDVPVAIHCMERYIGDAAVSERFAYPTAHRKKTGKRIAVAGGGPAGLSAAYFLTRLGYDCDVFEKESEPGGLLYWGIPSYRLPKQILKQEISRIEKMGISIFCNKPVSRDFLDHASKTYHALIISCGYSRPIQLGIAGEDHASDALALLNQIQKGVTSRIKVTAAVIGGGNSAVDAARSLVRLGAKPVIVYRRKKEDMPAFSHEVRMALSEGVDLIELAAPIRIEKDEQGLTITLQKMKTDGITADGRSRVIPDGNLTETLLVDIVYSAIGAEPDDDWQNPPLPSDHHVIKLSHCCMAFKDIPVIFTGDLTNDVKSVTDAIASGKQAALSLDIFFEKGRDAIREALAACQVGNGTALSMEVYLGGSRKFRSHQVVQYEELNLDYFQPAPRTDIRSIPADQAIHSFEEIETAFTDDNAHQEASRCFNCGLCNNCDNCNVFCPEMAVISEGKRQILLDYCKGCGICVVECPRNAMQLEEENE